MLRSARRQAHTLPHDLAINPASVAQWFSVAIELERQYGPVERVWSVLGPNNRWSYKEFKSADLQGQIAILVEDGSPDGPTTEAEGQRSSA